MGGRCGHDGDIVGDDKDMTTRMMTIVFVAAAAAAARAG